MYPRHLFLVGLLLYCAGTEAADDNGQFAIKGIGLRTCQEFVAARETQSPQYFQFGGWMEGYLSATNRYEEETFDLVPWQSSGVLASWLETFCKRNPDATFVRAVAMLVNALGRDRLTIRSEFVEFEIDGETRYVYASTLHRVQRALVERGYYQGTPNGALDAATREALERFQTGAGLTATGFPDSATLAKLLQ